MDGALDYDQLLLWMQTVITHPSTAAEGAASVDAQALVQGDATALERVILPSQHLSGLERLAIYARAFHARLAECLLDDHAATRHAIELAVGAETAERSFNQLLSAYIAEHPPTHYSLDQFGLHFPDFLRASNAPICDRIGDRTFLFELARLERAVTETFHLAPPTLLTADEINAMPPDELMAATLEFARGVKLMRASHPVSAFLHAFDQGLLPGLPAPQIERLMVYRKGTRVWRMTASRAAHATLTALASGRPLARALAIGHRLLPAEVSGDDAVLATLSGWLQEWTSEGLFARIKSAER